MFIGLNSRFELSLIDKGDTTFIKHKHFFVDTEFDLNDKTKILNISPTEIQLEKATFGFDGSVALNENVDLDLRFHGSKPNFNLFLALAPEELAPTLEQFDNKGKIYHMSKTISEKLGFKRYKNVQVYMISIAPKFACFI